MSTKHAQNQRNNANHHKFNPFPKKSILKYLTQPMNKLIGAIKEQADGNGKEQDRAGRRERTHQEKANGIAIWAVVVNTCIFGVTTGLLWYTIVNIKGVRSQFEVGNQPFLELTIDKIDSLDPNRRVGLLYSVFNYGNYPAKIIDCKSDILIDTIDPTFDKIKSGFRQNSDALYKYINKETPSHFSSLSDENLGKDRFVAIFGLKRPVYFCWYIEYENLITREIRPYKVIIKFPAIGVQGARYLLNDNGEGDTVSTQKTEIENKTVPAPSPFWGTPTP